MTDEGWQLLRTQVDRETGSHVVLEARTPNFSPFAVFPDNEIEYTWEIGNETASGQEVVTRFRTPGVHNATLTVTDSFDRSDNATVRLLVNDVPRVTIDEPTNLTADEPVTPVANVTNEVGNATVTWTLPDGTRRHGETIEHTFGSGEQTVRVIVEDEYGAIGEAGETFGFGASAARELLRTKLAGSHVQLVGLGASVAAALLLLVVLWRAPGGSRPGDYDGLPSIGALFRRRAPRIEALDEPTVDVRNRRFLIGSLRIRDPDGDLETVEISVNDERGNEVARKRIDLRGRTEYRTRNHVIVPKSRVYVREDGAYTITVRARDADDRWSGTSRTSVRGAGAAVA